MSDSLPKIRDDLRITPFSEGGEDNYIIEDALRNTFYKIGLREYRFLCRLNQIKTLAELKGSNDSSLSDISEDEALSILQWLAAKQLLQNQSQETMEAIEVAERQARQKGRMSRLNILIFRLPLFNPDPLLDRCLPWINWLAGPIFLILWILTGLIAITVLLANWPQFISESAGFFSPTNVIIVGLIWISLKLLHELSHAITCKRYGGGVYEFGILFILFIPLTYVNATTSWGFATKWQRLHVAVAGIYMELFVAWAAAIYWVTHIGTPGAIIAHNTVLIAGVSSLLFNANPLMRFDGYFILSDLTSLPNLYFRGLNSVRTSARKWWLGINDTVQSKDESLFVRLYGIGVYCWRILVLFSLSYIASKMFSGGGLILALVAAIGWIYQPMANFFAKFPDYRLANPRVISHFLTRFILVTLLAGFGLFQISWHKSITVPAVVLFEEQHVIRAEASGFVQEVYVKPGDHVQKDDRLILLINEDLESDRKILALDLKKIELQKRTAHVQNNHSDLQILENRQNLLTAKKRNLDEDAQALLIRAPGSGRVVGKMIKNRLETMVHKGEEMFLVVKPEHKHLVASVDQNDITALREQLAEDVVIDIRGTGLDRFSGKIKKIVPQASKELIHFSLAAPFGGPFDVRSASNGTYQLFSPRFAVHIAIPQSIRHTLRDGQQAVIRVKGARRTPADIIWKNCKSWFLGRQGVKNSG